MKLMINLVRAPMGVRNQSTVRVEVNVAYDVGEPPMDPGDRDFMVFETLMTEAVRGVQPLSPSESKTLAFLHRYLDNVWATLQKPQPQVTQA